MNSLRKIVSLCVFSIFFIGCSTLSVPKEVYIPVKCKATIPDRPTHKNYEEDIINILSYTEKLEKIVEVCVEGE